MDDRQPVNFKRRALSYFICSQVALQPMLPAVATQITPATPGTQMDAAANGVPVVNIATPNGAGVSHNQYQQYNVGQEGLILNNATGQLNQTQLGGLIQNNPNLKAGHEAQAIINEVTGANRSQLQGYTEVAGKAASVMVANPYGITCNGCGFINTPNVTLTTGRPQLDANGNLAALEVSKGSVIVEGKGLDGSSADAVSIVARATEINAGIYAKELAVTVGASRVGADGSVTPIAGEGAAPSVAVDTGALGGMYANRIHLVSSEQGVGVNLGNLVAKQGDIQLDSSGQLRLNNSLSSGALMAKGTSVALGGDNKAAGQITVTAQQDAAIGPGTLVSNAGIAVSANGTLTTKSATLTAGRDIRLSGGALSADQASRGNAGEAIALQARTQLNNSGQFTTGKSLSVTAQRLDNSGSLAAAAMTINADRLNNSATVAGTASLSVTSNHLLNQGVLSAPALAINSTQTDNSGLLQGTEALTFSGVRLSNLAGGTLSSNNDFSFSLEDTDNSGVISSGAALTLGGRSLTNKGEINAANLTLLNERVTNQAGGSLLAERQLQLTSADLNNGGKIAADTLAIRAGAVSNSGTLQAQQKLEAQGQTFTNSGTLLSEGGLTLNADRLDNAGSLQSQQLAITTSRVLNSGEVLSLSDASLTADRLNNSGSILSQQALRLSSGETDNSGLIQGTRTLSLTGQRLTNLAQGTISSENSFELKLPELNNFGLITSGVALTFGGDSLINAGEINAAAIAANNSSLINQQGARLLADNALQLNNAWLTNVGEIAASQLNIDGAILDNSGVLQGREALRAAGQQLSNSGTLLSGGELKLEAGTLTNSGLMQSQQLNLTAGSWQNSGNALSVGDAQLKAESLNNSGKILGQQHVEVQADKTDNSGWLLAQVLTLQSDLVNSGLIQGANALAITGGQLNNQTGGELLSAGTLTLQGDSLINQGSLQAERLDLRLTRWQNPGSARATSQLIADVSNLLDNSGSLLSEKRFDLTSGAIRNDGTLAADQLAITTASLTNAGLLQGNSALTLSSAAIANQADGQLISGSSLSLSPLNLSNSGLLQIAGDFDLNGGDFSNSGTVTAENIATTLTGSLNNRDSGLLLARQQATLHAATLENSGSLAAQLLAASGDTLTNRGLMQGEATLSADFAQLDNLIAGTLLSGGDVTLLATSGNNAGVVQGSHLNYRFASLANSGTVNGIATLIGSTTALLDNSGTMVTQGSASLTAGRLVNSGKLVAQNLLLRGDTLSNSGLWQGSALLDVQATNEATQTAPGKALSGGDLLLSAFSLTTDGTLQGKRAQIEASSWQHQGMLLSDGDVTASVSGDLRNGGEIMSQGAALMRAQTLENTGSLLAEKAMTLQGEQLNNSGSVQGDTLTITPASVTNQGSLIGLHSLTLGPAAALRGLRGLAERVLVNNAGGRLLTQGTLSITGDSVTNNGTWQGQQILLNAASLANGGAIQSADNMQLNLRDRLSASADSKITANGDAALSALNLSNQGQWIAKNLTLNGASLDNGGEIAGVTGLTAILSDTLMQQQNGALLSGGRLELQTTAINNAGRVQGADLSVTTGAINNSGRLQGDNRLLLTASGRVTNEGRGTLLSQGGLTLTTPELYNYGLIQGATSRITASGSATNAGSVLSAGELTLNAPQFTNSGWLQAAQLTLNAANASNSGTLLADGQSTLTGTQLQNQGTTQGGSLTLNYAQLTNGGTLLGVDQLNVKAAQVTQQATGRLFSGGNLLLESGGFDQLGQVIALGDATLTLMNSFTARHTLAAGKRLSISSDGAIENQGTLQGEALTLSAGGDFTNNGQITTGAGDSSLSGSRISMNSAGALQGGGNVSLNSRSDITVEGFTGTLGNLTLSSPGSIINAALLYAGQNLALYANSIRNQRGDMLAGNSLWMQGDAAGNASGEVINTSGTIESQNGDISIKTGHLLNTRDGLQVTQTRTDEPTRDGVGDATLKIHINDLPEGSYGSYSTTTYTESGGGCAGADGGCSVHYKTQYYYAPLAEAATQKFALNSSSVEVVSNGGAGRISSGRDLRIQAESLDNQASTLLAQRDIALSGIQLNNQSWQAGTQNDYLIYQWQGKSPVTALPAGSRLPKAESNYIVYTLTGHETSFMPGELYRSVIQAGGNVSASFSGDISNTATTANAGWSGNILSAPAVAGLAELNQAEATQRQALANSSQIAVSSPAWQDQLENALLQVNAGVALDDTKPGNLVLTPLAGKQQGQAALGGASSLENGSLTPVSLTNTAPAKVDTSAYPLPASSSGYFVAGNSDSPYLITVNPKLDGLGQLDASLFGELSALLDKQPGSVTAETRQQYTDVNTFLGSAYLLDRLDLNPDRDYRFLGDAAFDTRYVSNAVLNQTGSRYLHGIGSDLDQMRYLMDNAAAAQQSLGLQFGLSLSAAQVAALDSSIIWWEAATINGQTVMVPKVYLSASDAEMHNGSVIAGNNVTLSGGNILNDGGTLMAKDGLTAESQNRMDNLSAGLISAGGDLQLSALGDINNVSSTIQGKKVELESLDGSINSLTTTKQWILDAGSKSFSETLNAQTASIASIDALSLSAGNNINLTAANLTSGGDMLLNAWNDIAITGNQQVEGQSQGGEKVRWYTTEKTSTQTVSYVGSEISAGGNLALKAGHDLSVTASSLAGKGNTALAAGNDLLLNSAATSQNSSKGNKETHSSDVDRTAITSGGDLSLSAGQDLTSQAAAIVAEGDVGLQAGRDISLNAEASRSGDSERGSKKTVINETVRQQGTEIVSGGDISVKAGHDITSQASDVTAQQDIALQAGHNVDLGTAAESDYYYREETKTKKSLFSKKTTHTIQEESASREKGTLLSGDTVSVSAGNDLTVTGSQLVGDGKVALSAGNNVEIGAATNSDSSWRFSETHKSGLMGTGGLGLSIGSSKTLHEIKDKGTTQSQSFSTVGSTAGDVSITAGNQLQVNGADLIAAGNMALQGDSVAITPGHDLRTHDERMEQRTSGLTLALSGAVGEAVNSAVATAQSAKQESDGRLAALQATKSVLSGVQASQASQLAQVKGDPNNGVGISLSLATQQAKSQQHQVSDSVSGSTINAGKNLSIDATGKGNGVNSGDLLIAGSQLKAGGDTSLQAAKDITLAGAASTQQTTGKNSSSGGGLGVSLGAGAGSAGLSIFASVNGAKGYEKGDGTLWSETTLDSGGDLSITSGRDTTLSGAQVNGKRVTADIGRDLTITSLQDSDNYDSKQSSFGAGGSFTFGSMTGSGYVNASQEKMNSRYSSVLEQSGIYAGEGGFDITVGSHTQLNGAVIASQADAGKNRLETGTLGFKDMDNQAAYKTEHQGAGFSSGASMGGQFAGNMANTLLAGAGSKGHAEGTTQSAVAEGTIVVRNQASQQQSLADLSRDPEHANDSISPIFNKEKEQKRLQTAQMIAEIGVQVADIARTQGEIAGLQAQANPEALAAAREALRAKGTLNPTADETAKQAFDTAMKPFGTGSALQQGLQAATAAIQGIAGGSVAQAVAGGAAPYIAGIIGSSGLDDAGKVMAHAAVNAALAAAQCSNALVGAAGAATAEMAGMIALEVYGKSATELSETEKQTVSALATLAAGLAGGLTGGRSADAVAGAQAGKMTVENNLMGGHEDAQAEWIRQHGTDMATCSDNPSGAACQKAMNERNAVGLALATGSVALLPGGAQAMWGLGAGANAGISYLADGMIDPANAVIAGWVNVFSMGNGLMGTVGWNAAGGALGNWIDDKNPLSGAITNGFGAGFGYGIGKGISWGTNAGANWWKDGWDPKFNSTLQKYTEIKGDYGISKEMTPSNFPGLSGDVGGSITSELGGKYTEQKMKQEDNKK